ncbi:RDD family protein [Streptomyces sp. NPDC050504]|uniref:RDD family protein n=1 Tax=Streptomyces sp. NPDC050504 TaxID=3365618 RepID=UPI003792FFF8
MPPYGSAPPPPYDPNAYGGGGGGYGGDPLAGMPPLADSGKRILARIIDWFIIFVPLAIIGIPLGSYDKITSNTDDFGDVVDQMNSGGQWVLQIISIVAYVGYDWYMTKQSGQTVGKRVMNIRVAMLNDGRVPDSSASMLRAVVLWLPGLICCPCVWPLVLLVLILVDKPYKQGLHDKAGKTVVVSVR